MMIYIDRQPPQSNEASLHSFWINIMKNQVHINTCKRIKI